ncbi:MAG TPA: hypothetical protein PLM07_02320 [Candidatus Rifleibacterium sp.]|nr:hypothetical protein [Candidatus Rifleibacterium sp.]HPT44717.1 hypothetical protein [Candidatus Rifleibacterium sp.]
MTSLKTYSYPVEGNPGEMLEKFRNKIQSKGLAVEGDVNSGMVSGFGFKATYSLLNSNLTIDVLEKPAIIPWSMLDEKMKP